MTATLLRWVSVSFILVGCSQQSFDRSESQKSLGSKEEGVAYTVANTSSESTNSENATTGKAEGVIDPATSTDLGSDGTVQLITTEPAISPKVVAGASLTCQRGEPRTEITCLVKSNGIATDVLPKNIYVIKGKTANWVATPFRRTQIGTYLFAVEARLPASFAVGLTYSDNQYLVAMVGDAYPEYNNVVRDSGFDSIPLDNGTGPISRVPTNQLLATNSPWKMQARSGQSSCPINENDALVELRNLNRAGASFPRNRTLYLDSSCPSGGGVNMLLMQGLSLESNRIYRIYASYKASATPEAGAASQNLQIGIGQSGGTSIFENFSASDTKWHLAQFNITTDIPTHFLFAAESGTADGVGMMIDDIRLYDLGIPKLD